MEELDALLRARPMRYERRYPQAVEYLRNKVEKAIQESLREEERLEEERLESY